MSDSNQIRFQFLIGTHFVAGTPLGPNDMQFYFNNSLRAEDVMFEKHADPENYKNKPFDLAVAMGICPVSLTHHIFLI